MKQANNFATFEHARWEVRADQARDESGARTGGHRRNKRSWRQLLLRPKWLFTEACSSLIFFRACSYSKPFSRVMDNVFVFSRITATSLGAFWLRFPYSIVELAPDSQSRNNPPFDSMPCTQALMELRWASATSTLPRKRCQSWSAAELLHLRISNLLKSWRSIPQHLCVIENNCIFSIDTCVLNDDNAV